MPSIGQIKTEVQRPEEVSGWKEEQVYRSPDYSRDVVFHDPSEFHMEAEAWKLKLVLTDSGKIESCSGYTALAWTNAQDFYKNGVYS